MMWKEKYKIGIDLIDTQHEELFARVSGFIGVMQSKELWDTKIDKIKDTMNFMQEYVVKHFDDEEEYQEQMKYEYILQHKLEHKKFKSSVGVYVDRLNQEGFSEELVKEFGGKLMTWLIMHVAKEDVKIGEYMSKKGGCI